MERKPTNPVEDRRPSPKESRFAPHDDIVAIGLDVLLDADGLRQTLAQCLDELFLAWKLLGRCHDDNHEIAFFADATDDVTEHARVLVLMIDGDMQGCDDFPDRIDDLVVSFFLDMAIACIDDLVASLCETADDSLPSLPADGELHLVPIIPRTCRAKRRCNENILLPADACNRIDHLLALRLELRNIRKMLELATAAPVINGADRLDAVRTFGDDFSQLPFRVRLLDFRDDGFDLLARQGLGHEDRKILVPSYAFPTCTERMDFDLI